jgi:hypothetical protein
MFCIRRFAAAILIGFVATQASAAPVAFGSRSIEIPAPAGFQPIANAAPWYLHALEAYQPPTNRLAEIYVLPADATALVNREPKPLERYFLVAALRKLDGVPTSPADFDGAKAQIEDGINHALANSGKALQEIADKGNAEIARRTSTDPKLALSGLQYLGVYRREPWGLFFTMKEHVASADSAQGDDIIGAASVALINYQVVYLYAYAHDTGDADRRWAEQAVSTWADALRAANPDDPALASKAVPLEQGFDWSSVFGKAVIGAVIGGLIGLIAMAISKRTR